MAYFALTTVHGPNWDDSVGIRQQRGWQEHAAFMDGLVEEGFVILGGPLADGKRAMLVIEAENQHVIEARLSRDPWSAMGLLEIGVIEPWTIWLDGRQSPPRDG